MHHNKTCFMVERLLAFFQSVLIGCFHRETCKEYRDGRLFLRCVDCGRISPGIELKLNVGRGRVAGESSRPPERREHDGSIGVAVLNEYRLRTGR